MQLLLLIYYNLFTVIFVGYLKPFYKREMNTIEFMNETLLCVYTIILSVFTNYCPDFDMKYELGFYATGFIVAIFGINMFPMARPYLRKAKLYCMYYYKFWFKPMNAKEEKEKEARTIEVKEFPRGSNTPNIMQIKVNKDGEEDTSAKDSTQKKRKIRYKDPLKFEKQREEKKKAALAAAKKAMAKEAKSEKTILKADNIAKDMLLAETPQKQRTFTKDNSYGDKTDATQNNF